MKKNRRYRIVSTEDTCWGNPRLDGTRLTVSTLAGRFAAADSIDFIAKDYKIPRGAFEEIVRAVCSAAYSSRGYLRAVVRKQLWASAKAVRQ